MISYGQNILMVYINQSNHKSESQNLTHWGRVTHICVFDLTIIGSDNSLSPGRQQAIIRTNARILLFRPLGTHFSEILIGIQAFSFTKMYVNMSSTKWHPFCLSLNVLNQSHSGSCSTPSSGYNSDNPIFIWLGQGTSMKSYIWKVLAIQHLYVIMNMYFLCPLLIINCCVYCILQNISSVSFTDSIC